MPLECKEMQKYQLLNVVEMQGNTKYQMLNAIGVQGNTEMPSSICCWNVSKFKIPNAKCR